MFFTLGEIFRFGLSIGYFYIFVWVFNFFWCVSNSCRSLLLFSFSELDEIDDVFKLLLSISTTSSIWGANFDRLYEPSMSSKAALRLIWFLLAEFFASMFNYNISSNFSNVKLAFSLKTEFLLLLFYSIYFFSYISSFLSSSSIPFQILDFAYGKWFLRNLFWYIY